jgi:hypothetical protein
MSYDLNTFSNTPAGQYLTRIINERNPGAMKSCSNRIRTFNTNVNEIEHAVADGHMSAHVAANLLRLLRIDATLIELGTDVVEGKFISQLLRNVIIGHIKRAIRRVTTMRKIESGNVNLPKVRTKGARTTGEWDNLYSVYNILGHTAGVEFADGRYYRQFPMYEDLEDSTTPELLMERSNRRCLRQGKQHMIEKESKNG